MGETSDSVLAAINTGAFILCVGFLAYVLLIVVPFLRRRRAVDGDSRDFAWHFLVPCLNEETVIEGTVTRLLSDFPEVEVWCVDDASSDRTPGLLAGLAAAEPRVHIVTRRLPHAREGKGAALNAGWRAIDAWQPAGTDRDRVIVGVLDADGWLSPGSLDTIVGPASFGDESVGAVQVQVRMIDHVDHDRDARHALGDAPSRTSRALVRLQDVEFASVIGAMQTLRRHIGSVGMGGNGQFTRLSILNRVADGHGSPWHGALLEDLELGLHVLLAGSRTEYCHDAWVAQQALPTVSQLIRQRSRWAQGSMQCFRYLVPVLRSPLIPTAAAIEIAHFLLLPWLQLVGSLLYLTCGVLMVRFALTLPGGPISWFANGAWGLVPLFVCFGLGPLMLWGPLYRARTDKKLGFGRSLLIGVANWPYTYVHQVAVWWAFVRVLRNRADWKKSDRRPVMPTLDALQADRHDERRRSDHARGQFRPRGARRAGRLAAGRFHIRTPVSIHEPRRTSDATQVHT